jgi:hypothetical protein
MNKQDAISHDDLLKSYFYDPDDGILYRRINGKNCNCGWKDKLGYARMKLNDKEFMTHRVIWFYVHKTWPKHEIDHINGITSDNRISNLRDVPHHINLQNLRSYKKPKNTHPYMGICFHARDKLWAARIRVNGKRLTLGYFKRQEDAANAYLEAKRKLHDGCSI